MDTVDTLATVEGADLEGAAWTRGTMDAIKGKGIEADPEWAALLALAKPRLMRRAQTEQAIRPMGSAMSRQWAHKGYRGTLRTARQLSRTRRCCPTCLETAITTETVDSLPYCSEHAEGPYRAEWAGLVVAALGGYSRSQLVKRYNEEAAEQAALDKAVRDAAANRAKRTTTDVLSALDRLDRLASRATMSKGD